MPPHRIDPALPTGCTNHHRTPRIQFDCDLMQIFHIRARTDPSIQEALLLRDTDDPRSADPPPDSPEGVIYERFLMHMAMLRAEVLLVNPGLPGGMMTMMQKEAFAGMHLPSALVHLLAQAAADEDSGVEPLRLLSLAMVTPEPPMEVVRTFWKRVKVLVAQWVGEGRAPVLMESTMAEAVKVVGGRGGVTGRLGGEILEDGAVRRVAAVGGMWSLHDVRYMQCT